MVSDPHQPPTRTALPQQVHQELGAWLPRASWRSEVTTLGDHGCNQQPNKITSFPEPSTFGGKHSETSIWKVSPHMIMIVKNVVSLHWDPL